MTFMPTHGQDSAPTGKHAPDVMEGCFGKGPAPVDVVGAAVKVGAGVLAKEKIWGSMIGMMNRAEKLADKIEAVTSIADTAVGAVGPLLPGRDTPAKATEPCPKAKLAKHALDVNRNDLKNFVGAMVNLPLAILLRGVAAIDSDFSKALIESPALQSRFGTGDHKGVGVIFGDNSAYGDEGQRKIKPGTPGIFGIAMGLAHAEGIWGDAEEFERGQLRHNISTGEDKESEANKSSWATAGEGFGILAKHLGVGPEFHQAVVGLLGESKGYDFVSGVESGALPQDPSTLAGEKDALDKAQKRQAMGGGV